MNKTVRKEIRKTYPEVLSLEHIRCILHISKRKAAWMLQNGIIKCENNGKKTRQYKVKIDDLLAFMEKAEKGDKSVDVPVGIFSTKNTTQIPEPTAQLPPIIFTRLPSDFKEWLSDEWYAESDALLIEDLIRLTGYTRGTLLKWIRNKTIRTVLTQDDLVTAKIWLIEFLCNESHKILNKSDAHIKLIKKYYGIT